MNRIIDPSTNIGDLFHAMLEGLIIVEIGDAISAKTPFEPSTESRRGPGIRSIRGGRVSISGAARPAK
jgi:hypothetical protein